MLTPGLKKLCPLCVNSISNARRPTPISCLCANRKNLIAELREQTRVSLHEKIREQERKANDEKRLQLENNRRKAKGMKLLSSFEELDAEAEAEAAATDAHATGAEDGDTDLAAGDSKKAKEDDAMLTEAGLILVDYLKLNSQALTAQRQP